MNHLVIDRGAEGLKEFKVKPEWLTYQKKKVSDDNRSYYIREIAEPLNNLEGYSLNVSAFEGYENGKMDVGSTAYEKRAIANLLQNGFLKTVSNVTNVPLYVHMPLSVHS